MSQLSAGMRNRLAAGISRFAAVLALAAALSGCYSDRQVVDNYPNDVRQRHPIAIREGEHALEIFVGADRGGLTPAQRADVVAFAHRWRREATGRMMIEVPVATGNEIAAAAALREIRSVLSATGVPPGAVVARRYRPADPMRLATIRILYPNMVAEAGPCGLWPHDIGPSVDGADFQNREYWNFGCANQRNLAAMVDNPADLVQPRGDAPLFAARRSTMLEKYRKGEDPSGKYGADKDSKISDVGK